MRHPTKTTEARKLSNMIPALLLLAAVTACAQLHTRSTPKTETETAPDFSLPGADGTVFTLDKLLEKGPAVVVFYRGYW